MRRTLIIPLLCAALGACSSGEDERAADQVTPDTIAGSEATAPASAVAGTEAAPAGTRADGSASTPAAASRPDARTAPPSAAPAASTPDGGAGIPMVNADCPGGIAVHSDAGGPIYLNGKEAKLKKFNDRYFEAKGGDVTISLSINPDGSPAMSYTGPGRANGICTIK